MKLTTERLVGYLEQRYRELEAEGLTMKESFYQLVENGETPEADKALERMVQVVTVMAAIHDELEFVRALSAINAIKPDTPPGGSPLVN